MTEQPPPPPSIAVVPAPKKPPGGRRPYLLDHPEVIDQIVRLTQAGNYLYAAAQACGLGATTVSHWLERGRRQPKSIYGTFEQAIRVARAKAEVSATTLIKGAALGGAVVKETTVHHKDGSSTTTREFSRPEWAAAAFLLERMYPNRWGRRLRLENESEFDRQARVLADREGLDVEEVKAVAREMRAALDESERDDYDEERGG